MAAATASEGERHRRWRLDALVVVALVGLSIAPRLASRPRTGFFHDDAWTAASALRGGVGQVYELGVNHPGFTALLMLLRPLAEWNPNVLVWPALAAGILAPAIVYAFLRRSGISWVVALGIATVVVVAPIHVLVSGRVKPFTIDVIVVIVAAVLTDRAARVPWTPAIGVAWVVGAIVVSTLSPYALLAAAIAGLTVVLHPRGDLRLRVVAIGAQAAVSIAYLSAVRETYNAEMLETFWEVREDAYIGFSANPVELLADVIAHTGQVVGAFTATSPGVGSVLGLGAIAGLVHAAVVARSVVGRYLALLLGAGIVLSVMELSPYGANKVPAVRVGLWMIPVFGYGAARALHALRGPATEVSARTSVVDAAMVVGAVVVLVTGLPRAHPYPWYGTEPAAEFVAEQLRPGDVVLLLHTARYSYAVYGTDDVEVIDAPEKINGMTLVYGDERVLGMTFPDDPSRAVDEIAAALEGAARVLVFTGINSPGGDSVVRAVPALESAGLTRIEDHWFQSSIVAIWEPALP